MMVGMILLMMLMSCESNGRSFLVETTGAKSYLVETANNSVPPAATVVPPAATVVPLSAAVQTAAYHENNARSFLVETNDAKSYLVETSDNNVRKGIYNIHGEGLGGQFYKSLFNPFIGTF